MRNNVRNYFLDFSFAGDVQKRKTRIRKDKRWPQMKQKDCAKCRTALGSAAEAQKCPKSSRCYYGKNCPREYEPDAIYGCFERHTPKRSISQYSKAELIAIINFACRQSPEAKGAIDEARNLFAHNQINESNMGTLAEFRKGEK